MRVGSLDSRGRSCSRWSRWEDEGARVHARARRRAVGDGDAANDVRARYGRGRGRVRIEFRAGDVERGVRARTVEVHIRWFAGGRVRRDDGFGERRRCGAIRRADGKGSWRWV